MLDESYHILLLFWALRRARERIGDNKQEIILVRRNVPYKLPLHSREASSRSDLSTLFAFFEHNISTISIDPIQRQRAHCLILFKLYLLRIIRSARIDQSHTHVNTSSSKFTSKSKSSQPSLYFPRIITIHFNRPPGTNTNRILRIHTPTRRSTSVTTCRRRC